MRMMRTTRTMRMSRTTKATKAQPKFVTFSAKPLCSNRLKVASEQFQHNPLETNRHTTIDLAVSHAVKHTIDLIEGALTHGWLD